MFFVLSKLFFAVARPFHLLMLIMAVGLILQLFGRRSGRWLLGFGFVVLCVIAFTPVADYIETPLEMRFPRPGLIIPAPDGILILGGAVDTKSEAGRQDFVSLNAAAERITEIPRLSRLYPNARIIITGGPDHEGFGIMPESQATRELLIEFGVPADRITIEDKSMTTWENATLTKALINPAPDSHWLLVTSAFHMPRSVGVFRQAGWPGIIAYPTDYRMPDPKFGLNLRSAGVENLDVFEIAAKEWYGMLGYYLSGRSNALFPAP